MLFCVLCGDEMSNHCMYCYCGIAEGDTFCSEYCAKRFFEVVSDEDIELHKYFKRGKDD